MKTKIAMFALTFAAWLLLVSPALGATTAPAWQLSLIPLPTNFAPGSTGSTGAVEEAPIYRVVATNIGAGDTSGPVTITTKLPVGITPVVGPDAPKGDNGDLSSPEPVCSTSGQVIECTAPGPVRSGRWFGGRLPVAISSTLPIGEVLTAEASVSGGGAATVTTTSDTRIDPQPPSFGFLSGPTGFSSLITNADGSAAVQAGSHPDQMTVNLTFTTEHREGSPTTGAGHVRDLVTDLPHGLIVNPNSTQVLCTEAQFLAEEATKPGCPEASQLGTVTAMSETSGPAVVISNLYNMVPPPGAPAAVAFNAFNVGIFVHLQGSVRNEGDYGLSAGVKDILARANNPVLSAQAQLWGDPTSSTHDQIRGVCRDGGNPDPCPVDAGTKPLLTMPSACSDRLTTAASADSWEDSNPDVKPSASYESTDTVGNPVGVTGCSLLAFKPSLTVRPDTGSAESPTGVEIELSVPQNEGKKELATSDLRDTVITFPAGMALNPAAAGGRSACTPGQIGLRTEASQTPPRFSGARPQCPESSKIGTVEVDTPLLDHPVPGAVYIAQPYANPFGTLLAAYVVIDDPDDGIVVKLAGKTEANPDTGQLTVTFEENPELPFAHFRVDLFSGPKAALRTPSTCGVFTTTSLQTPWSGNEPVPTTDSFTVNQGANGRPCVNDEAQMPSTPGFEAGTQTPLAASYSPFLGRLQRADGTQQLKALNLNFPAGLTGKLAGLETCSESALVAAAAKTGNQELASPSCPVGSQIGEVKVGAGAGPNPYYTTGKIYLTGPFEGGPISAAVITPAVAGPFDLGTVVIRTITKIDPTTAALSIQSEDAPHILQGIPLEIRDIQIALDKPQFTLNPTNCNEKAIAGQAASLLGAITPLAQRFQVGGCKGLDYEPKLAIRLFGKTGRGAHPRLRAILQTKPGEANTARASVALPHSEFLENAHIGTVCTRVQFAADKCPAKAIYGHATAITPLLDEPLEGPVYLRSSSHKLPDMVVALSGPATRPIKVELVGRIDSVNGGIRSTFDLVPDQPVTKFVLNMFGGKKGLIVNSRNLCEQTYRATAKFNGQNGKVHDFNPALTNDCKKGKGKAQR